MLNVVYVSPDGEIIETFEMADNMTVSEAAHTVCPDTEGKFPVPTIALVGATPAVRGRGDWDVPLADCTVQFRQLAQGGGGGGGSNALQMVFQVAIVALAALATWYVGGAGGWAVGAGFTAGQAMFMGALAGSAVMTLGTLVGSLIFKQNMPKASGLGAAYDAAKASPTYSINASGNQARLYQTEPEGFGRMKIVPDFVANTWTEYRSNDQYGYFVYSVGRGHYDIESLQFGETVFWRRTDGTEEDIKKGLLEESPYAIEALQFVQPGEAVTIFPDNVVTSVEVSGQELYGPNDEQYGGVIGPYTTNPPGTKTNKLLFDFVFQQGLGAYNDQGALGSFTVKWDIEYRPVDDFGNASGDWATLEACTLTAATPTPQRLTKSYNVAEGRYEVRVHRTSNTSKNGRTMDNFAWGALRAMLPGTLTYPQSCVAFSVKANNALTQNASSQFSLIATRKLPLYDRHTQTWSDEVPTRSWAAAISHVCKSTWGGKIQDHNIDLDTLWRIDEELQARGWQYDSYIDGAYLVWDLLAEMCQSQCVIPRFVGPVLSFVQDAPDRAPTFALTPRNIVRNSFAVTYTTWTESSPDDVVLEYLDAEYGFQQRDVTATLPESESKEPYTLQILGITSREHAHKVAAAYAAHNRWQRVRVECQVENMGRIINRGDICTVSHPRFKNTASGMVNGFDKGLLKLTLKRDTSGDLPESSGGYWLALSQPNGRVWGPVKLQRLENTEAVFDQADYATLLLQGASDPFAWIADGANGIPTAFTLYTAKTYQRLMQVESVAAQDFMHYNLSLVNYDERIYQYDDLPVPMWQGRGQLPEVKTLAAPTGLTGVTVDEGTVRLTWVGVPRANNYETETSTDGENWVTQGKSAQNQMTVTVPAGVYHARVRAVNEELVSAWATVSGNTLLKTPDAPALTASAYTGATASLEWDAVDGAQSYVVNLWQGGAAFYTTEQVECDFEVTPEIQTGGPYRELTVTVAATNDAGQGTAARATLSDPLPPAPTEATCTAQKAADGTLSVTLTSITPDTVLDKAGYVVARGESAEFGINDVVELKQFASLPHTWTGLPADAPLYFRMAVVDEFWLSARDMFNLNWSGVLTVDPSTAQGA